MSRPIVVLVALLGVVALGDPSRAASRAARPAFLDDLAAARGAFGAEAAPSAPGGADTDSFGRNVKWDGLLQTGSVAVVQQAIDCPPAPGEPPVGPDDRCVVLNAAPATTSFDLPDIGRLTIPGRTAQSLLCHWLTPLLSFTFENSTGVAQPNARFELRPYVTVESDILRDPALINPVTGAPFGGVLESSFAANLLESKSLAAGERESHTFSHTRACIAGFLSKQTLIERYGLTPAQATDVFRRDLTLRFGVRGRAALVSGAGFLYGLRVVGD